MRASRTPSFIIWAAVGAVIGAAITLIAEWDNGALRVGVILLAAIVGGVWGTSLSRSEDD
ncbi:hypothetical protein LMIY3S_01129 [Labrys miyagiensis]